MELSLPSDVLETLPAPDDNGLVRVSVALKPVESGKFRVVEVNDVPTGKADATEEDDLDAATSGMPSAEDIASQIVG